MRKTIGINFIVTTLLLSGCATRPKIPAFTGVLLANERLKITLPEYTPFKVTGLPLFLIDVTAFGSL